MLRSELNDALKTAVKAQDQTATSTLRLILAALKDRDIAARSKGNCDGVAEDEILEMLQKMVRQRRESAELYKQGGRDELVEKEHNEIGVIERFLPQPLGEAEINGAVGEAMAETGAATIKDMGKVMSLLKERFPGRMDFGKVSAMVKERLA